MGRIHPVWWDRARDSVVVFNEEVLGITNEAILPKGRPIPIVIGDVKGVSNPKIVLTPKSYFSEKKRATHTYPHECPYDFSSPGAGGSPVEKVHDIRVNGKSVTAPAAEPGGLPPELTGAPVAPRRSPRPRPAKPACDECDALAGECGCAAEAAESLRRLEERVAAAQEDREAEDWSVVRDPGRKHTPVDWGSRMDDLSEERGLVQDPHHDWFGAGSAAAGIDMVRLECHGDGSETHEWRCRACGTKGSRRFWPEALARDGFVRSQILDDAQHLCAPHCRRMQKNLGRHGPQYINCRTTPGNHGPMIIFDEAESFTTMSEQAQKDIEKAFRVESGILHSFGADKPYRTRVLGEFPNQKDANKE